MIVWGSFFFGATISFFLVIAIIVLIMWVIPERSNKMQASLERYWEQNNVVGERRNEILEDILKELKL